MLGISPSGVKRRRRPRGRKMVVKEPASISNPLYRGTELKQIAMNLHDYFASVSTAGQQYDITGLVAQGADYNQRIGRIIRAIQCSVTGTLVGGQSNSATDDTRNTIRISILVAEAGTAFTYGVSAILDPRAIQGVRRILYDRVFSLSTTGADSTGYLPAVREMHIGVPVGEQIVYRGTAVSTNNPLGVFMYMVTDSAAVPHPGFEDGTLSLSFTDR